MIGSRYEGGPECILKIFLNLKNWFWKLVRNFHENSFVDNWKDVSSNCMVADIFGFHSEEIREKKCEGKQR